MDVFYRERQTDRQTAEKEKDSQKIKGITYSTMSYPCYRSYILLHQVPGQEPLCRAILMRTAFHLKCLN